jgi:hypothetical protein
VTTAASRARPARSPVVDWAQALGGLWVVAGIYADLGWHLRHDVDSFLTWAHGTLYAGLLYIFAVSAVVAIAGLRRGRSLARAFPAGYEFTLPGIVLFFIAGAVDALGHRLWGFESGFDALLSPTHQLIGLAIFFLLLGPLRSALAARPRFTTLAQQLPASIALGSILALIHWGINPFFETNAQRAFAPLSPAVFTPDAISLAAMKFDLQGGGIASVIVQSLLLAAFALYVARALGGRSGTMLVVFLIGNAFTAIAVGPSWPQALGAILATIAAGLVGDLFLRDGAALRASRRRLLLLAFAVPFAYHAALLAYTALFLGGIWWDPVILFGALLYSGVFGLLLGLVVTAVPSREAA